jgi:hypothetical protein
MKRHQPRPNALLETSKGFVKTECSFMSRKTPPKFRIVYGGLGQFSDILTSGDIAT